MKAICTSYTKTDKGLVLRNNWIETLEEEYLEMFLSKFLKDKSNLEFEVRTVKLFIKAKKIPNIIEGETELDNVIIHIRILDL